MRGRSPARPTLLVALAAAAVAVGCTEDPLALPGESAPGASAETRDLTIPVTDLELWRDTTYSGFALPAAAPFALAADEADLEARILGRLNVPDTVITFADTLPAEEYSDVRVRIRLDTLRSRFPEAPATLRLVSLTRGFDEDSVGWLQASPGVPWTTAGGDLGVELGSVEVPSPTDSLIMDLAVSGDSLLKAWRASDGENGFALLAEGSGIRLHVTILRFEYDATLEGRTEPVEQVQSPDVRTFITNPPLPATGSSLRVGGLPSARFYVEFRTPETMGGIPLAGATINFAELVFQPLPPPPEPFPLERALTARQVTLLADPFLGGPKTPLGAAPLSFVLLEPDSLSAGRPIRMNVTGLLSSGTTDVPALIRLGLRPDPDAQTLGYWEFGSVEADPALQPRLRIILTPPPEFEIP